MNDEAETVGPTTPTKPDASAAASPSGPGDTLVTRVEGSVGDNQEARFKDELEAPPGQPAAPNGTSDVVASKAQVSTRATPSPAPQGDAQVQGSRIPDSQPDAAVRMGQNNLRIGKSPAANREVGRRNGPASVPQGQRDTDAPKGRIQAVGEPSSPTKGQVERKGGPLPEVNGQVVPKTAARASDHDDSPADAATDAGADLSQTQRGAIPSDAQAPSSLPQADKATLLRARVEATHAEPSGTERSATGQASSQAADAAATAKAAGAMTLVATQQPVVQTLGTLAGGAPFAPTIAAAIPLAGIAAEIATRAQAGRSRFQIRLDPPELGRIDVRLDVDKNGQVTSHLLVDRPDTLDALRRDAGDLQRALQEAGLKTADNGLQFTLRDQSFAGRDTSYTPASTAPRAAPESDSAPPDPSLPAAYNRFVRAGSGIDIRV
jgi:chemotaxis protein MotD